MLDHKNAMQHKDRVAHNMSPAKPLSVPEPPISPSQSVNPLPLKRTYESNSSDTNSRREMTSNMQVLSEAISGNIQPSKSHSPAPTSASPFSPLDEPTLTIKTFPTPSSSHLTPAESNDFTSINSSKPSSRQQTSFPSASTTSSSSFSRPSRSHKPVSRLTYDG